jgi:hypothetical protein
VGGWFPKPRKMKLQVELSYILFDYTPKKMWFKHNVYVIVQKKNIWGKWSYESTRVQINGKWIIKMFYLDPVRFESSWSYNNYINNLAASINPQTGVGSAPSTQYSVTLDPSQDYKPGFQQAYQPYYDRGYWIASTPGVNIAPCEIGVNY